MKPETKENTSESRQTAKRSKRRLSESKRTPDEIDLSERSRSYDLEIRATEVFVEDVPEKAEHEQLPRQFDLSRLPSERYELSILPPESPEERSTRLRCEQNKHDHELKKDSTLFNVVLFVFVVAFITLSGLLLLSEDAANQQLARSMLPTFVASPIAYLFGKKSGGK